MPVSRGSIDPNVSIVKEDEAPDACLAEMQKSRVEKEEQKYPADIIGKRVSIRNVSAGREGGGARAPMR
jgi:hypothetical protein